MKLHLKFVQESLSAAACVLLLVALMACQSSSSGTTTSSGLSAIQLTGNSVGATLLIDDMMSFRITGENQAMQFKVRPGKHQVKIEKDGAVVLDKTVSVSAGQTLELAVP